MFFCHSAAPPWRPEAAASFASYATGSRN